MCGAELVAGSVRGADRLHGLPGRFEVAVCVSCGSGCTPPMLAPLTAVGRLLGEGDVFHAVAFLPESPAGEP